MTANEKVNILMVDDQPAKLLSYEVILAELGENLIKANSGREALEYLLKEDVAVVLMDVSMPEIDGFELADMIRQHPRFQKTVSNVEKQVKTLSLPNAQSDAHQQVMKLRKSLDPEDQALLILHIDRHLSWSEIAQIMIAPEEASDQSLVARQAAGLQARFELVTRNLKKQARENKLLMDE